MFITEARMNLTKAEESGEPSRFTVEELTALEKTLKEHEIWLNEVVEKQKSVKMNEDPAVESADLYSHAKVLEAHLQKLVKKRVPKKKAKPSSSSTSSTASPTESAESTSTAEGSTATPSSHDEL